MGQKFNASPDTPVFVLRVTCEGAAFMEIGENDEETYAPARPLAEILRTIADRLESRPGYGETYETIFDANGNDCGRVALKPTAAFQGQWPLA